MSDQEGNSIGLNGPFKTGSDIYFDYQSQTGANSEPRASNGANNGISSQNNGNDNGTAAAKKKKKKKNKGKVSPSQVHATINNPQDDYPTSRVIKQAPNGDVIVESLEENDHNHAHHGHSHEHHHHGHSLDHAHHQNKSYHNIWESASIEEQENLKMFWESLGNEQKMDLVRIDKKSIMEIFRQENRTRHNHSNANSSDPNNNSSSNINNANPNNCACKYCGRRSNIIEDELDNIYDNYFDDIIDFIHEVRDINDLNALPGLLFGGFHMLEEEHKLQKRQQRLKNNTEQHPPTIEQEISKQQLPDSEQPVETKEGDVNSPTIPTGDHFESSNLPENNLEQSKPQLKALPETELSKDQAMFPKLLDPKLFDPKLLDPKLLDPKLLDPKLFSALENLDYEKLEKLRDASNLAEFNYANLVLKAGSLTEMVKEFHKSDKLQSERKIFIQNMSNILCGANNDESGDKQNMLTNKFNDQFSQGLSSFAEDLLKNDGHSFIEMMETLSESRTAREDLLREGSVKLEEIPSNNINLDQEVDKILPQISEIREEHLNKTDDVQYEDDNESILEQEFEEDELEEEQDSEDDEYNEEDKNEEDGASDTESEISEEEKMQEIRRLFLIQVIKIFQERLKNAYKERLSQDRTQKLIEELEAEENAKKERELKKLKQKEKAKEKKRLQQLAKEEERKRKEDEQRAKEEELREKQIALKAEQKRRKEEARLKREEEKQKHIEELKRKEEEQKKKLEAQRKKQDETKKLKEERKKKADDERKRKEEEKRLKELEKKKREEEREQTKLEKEILAFQEMALKEQEAEPFVHHPNEFHEEFIDSKPTATNHLLDQLYHAKPRSNSTIANQIMGPESVIAAPVPNFASKLTPSPPTLMSNPVSSTLNISPSSMYASTINNSVHGTSANISPWDNNASLNTVPPANQTNLMSNPLGSNFNLFSNEPINSLASNNIANNGLGQSLWSQNSTSRNNSIWSNNINNPTMTNNKQNLSNSSLWGSGASSMSAVAPNISNIAPTGEIPDKELVETATYQAFQLLQSSNQLEYGVAPLLLLFQNTKSILNNHSITLNQYLSLIRSSSLYQIDFIYDNFGTVTHVNINFQSNIMSQPTPSPPPGLPTNINLSMNDSSFLNNTTNGFGTRSLWN